MFHCTGCGVASPSSGHGPAMFGPTPRGRTPDDPGLLPGWGRPLSYSGYGCVHSHNPTPTSYPHLSPYRLVGSDRMSQSSGILVHMTSRPTPRSAVPTDHASTSVLVAVDEPGLRTEARRAVAASGNRCMLQTAPLTRRTWKSVHMLIIDHDTAENCVIQGFPRRVGVIMVTAGEPTASQWRTATTIGAQSVVSLPDKAADLVRALGDYPGAETSHGAIVSVVGAAGGVGVSVFAAGLALRAAVSHRSGVRVLLVDGDPAGGGIDMVLGLEHEPGLRWSGLVLENGRISGAALHSALPGGPNLSVLSCGSVGHTCDPAEPEPLSPVAVESVLRAGRDAGDLVVCDVARMPTAAREVMLEAADVVVLLVTARLRSALAAGVVATQVRARNANQGLVVRGPAPGGLRAATIAAGLDLPLLASMRSDPGLAAQLERGGLRLRRRSPLRAAVDSVLTVLDNRPNIAAPMPGTVS